MLHIVYADGATETHRGVPVDAVHRIVTQAATVWPIASYQWTEEQP